MKATGIVRRIDDLGRVVIPKEIRRSLRIREGDPLEIFTVEGGVCFKPYTSWEQDVVTFGRALLAEFSSPLAIYDRQGCLVFSHSNDLPKEVDPDDYGRDCFVLVEGEVVGYVVSEKMYEPDQLADARKCARILSAYLR